MSIFVKTWFYTFSFTKFIFSFTLDILHTMPFCFYYWFWTGKYRLGRQSKMEDRCFFFIFILLLPLFRPSIFRVVLFFYIPIYRGYYAFRCHNFKANIQEKKQFSRWQSLQPGKIFWMVDKNERSKIRFYWYFGLCPKTIFKV